MDVFRYGLRTTHEPGEFSWRTARPACLITCFQTPFQYEYRGEMLRGDPGDLLLYRPNDPIFYGSLPDASEGYINDWIWLIDDNISWILSRYDLPTRIQLPLGKQNLLHRYLESVRQEYSARLPGYQDQLFYMTGRLLIDLQRIHQRNQMNTAPYDRIERVRSEVMGHLDKAWTLTEMAHLSGYSVSRFSALYKERYGCSPKQDFLNARIELASRLLKYTSKTVTEIAYECGFQSIFYFSKAFKEATGFSPRAYAEQA